ncbi:MAG: hypothetical protein ACXW00_02830 [Methylobacter sp.]
MKKLLMIMMLGLTLSAHGESVDDMIRRTEELAKPSEAMAMDFQKNNCAKLKASLDGVMHKYEALSDDIGKAVMLKDLKNELFHYKQICSQFDESSSENTNASSNYTQTQYNNTNSSSTQDDYELSNIVALLLLTFLLFILFTWIKQKIHGPKQRREDLAKILATYSKDPAESDE